MTQFDVTKAAAVLKILDLKNKGLIPDKTYDDIYKDFYRCLIENYHICTEEIVHSIHSFGNYFPHFSQNVQMYVEPQPELREVMNKLRSHGKKVFLATNSHVQYT